MRAYRAVLRKDLLLELRTRESVPAMALFSLTVFVIFHFGLDRSTVASDLAAGIFLVTLLLAALLGIVRLFVHEYEGETVEGFLLAPVDRNVLLFAKASALLLYLVLLELVALPAFTVLLLGPDPIPELGQLVVVLLLVDIGVVAVGTLVAALATATRSRELLVPLLCLPLLVPVVIAAAKSTAPLLAPVAHGPEGKWLLVLALYDTVFVLLAYGIFDFLWDD